MPKVLDSRDVFIVGGGISLDDFDFSKLSYVETIAVNMSVLYVPNADYFITADRSLLIKLLRYKDSIMSKPIMYYVAWGGAKDRRTRRIAKDVWGVDHIICASGRDTFGDSWSTFSSCGTSGSAAIQLALLLGYTNIYLLGLDYTVGSRSHFHGLYNSTNRRKWEVLGRKCLFALQNLPENFGDVRIVSCSEVSMLNEILPYMNPYIAIRNVEDNCFDRY